VRPPDLVAWALVRCRSTPSINVFIGPCGFRLSGFAAVVGTQTFSLSSSMFLSAGRERRLLAQHAWGVRALRREGARRPHTHRLQRGGRSATRPEALRPKRPAARPKTLPPKRTSPSPLPCLTRAPRHAEKGSFRRERGRTSRPPPARSSATSSGCARSRGARPICTARGKDVRPNCTARGRDVRPNCTGGSAPTAGPFGILQAPQAGPSLRAAGGGGGRGRGLLRGVRHPAQLRASVRPLRLKS